MNSTYTGSFVSKTTSISLFLIFALFCSTHLMSQVSEEITFNHEGLIVNGTFRIPAGQGPFPTLIIGPGSGPNDRDGTVEVTGVNAQCLYPDLYGSTLKPYKQLAEALADSGYAVLRYDKVEYTYPTTLEPISFSKLWLPVESAIDYVKTRADVDSTNITLIGHSESSYLIPYIAGNRSDVKSLISIAGPRAPFDSLLTYQMVSFTEMCNGDVNAANAQASQILAYYNLVRSGNYTANTPPLFGVPAGVWSDYLHVIDSVAINYNEANLPTLFIGLDEDINVPPGELARFENDITLPAADFWSIPGLNHYMTPMDNPDISMALTDTIIYWLGQLSIPTALANNPLTTSSPTAYPNPFVDGLTLKIDNYNSGIYKVRLLDELGREVLNMEKYLDNHVLRLENLERLSSGVYHIDIANGDERHVIKVVKH